MRWRWLGGGLPGTVLLAAVMVGGPAYAQEIGGDWQGTLKTDGPGLRIILHVDKAANGGWSGMVYSIDQGPEPMKLTSITAEGTEVRFAIQPIGGSYAGKLSADGKTIAGTWTQGGPLPLDLVRPSKESRWQIDPSPHTARMVTVAGNVKLEVLDWGGTGRPLVLLAGLGNTAHIFDEFAPKLTPKYHVYGVTRRGFGVSSAPAPEGANYSADRLGDDVLEVIDSLKLSRPVLVGHSIAGEELSSIGSRHPERVAGLVYLDAGYGYAFYDASRGDLNLDLLALRRELEELLPERGTKDPKAVVQELLETDLPRMKKDLERMEGEMAVMPMDAPPPTLPAAISPGAAIIAGEQRYTAVKVPILAIFAVPHEFGGQFKDPARAAAVEASDLDRTGSQAKAFETGLPTAHVVRLPHANHYVFHSNEADVLREMNAFLAGLPPD